MSGLSRTVWRLSLCAWALGCVGDGGSRAPTVPAIEFLNAREEAVSQQPFNEVTVVRVRGTAPRSRVALRASANEGRFSSHATFTANASGEVSTNVDAAEEESTYSGIDPDGLFWSMSPTEPTDIPRDARQTGWATADVIVEAEVDGRVVAKASLMRPFLPPNVTPAELHDDGLVGLLFSPNGADRHPFIVTLGGSEGSYGKGLVFAQFLASLGYGALALAYFGEPGLPPTLNDIPLEYFARAIDALKRRPDVDPDKIGVMGQSRGGELAYLLGATFPDVHLVLAMNPSHVIWGASWSLQGKTLPHLDNPGVGTTMGRDPAGQEIQIALGSFEKALRDASPADLDAATIRVENTNGPVLAIAGDDDRIWPACAMSQSARDRLHSNAHDQRFADDRLCYQGAGHFVGPQWAAMPTDFPQEYLDPRQGLFDCGGTPIGLAHGDRDAYQRVKDFLAQTFR